MILVSVGVNHRLQLMFCATSYINILYFRAIHYIFLSLSWENGGGGGMELGMQKGYFAF